GAQRPLTPVDAGAHSGRKRPARHLSCRGDPVRHDVLELWDGPRLWSAFSREQSTGRQQAATRPAVRSKPGGAGTRARRRPNVRHSAVTELTRREPLRVLLVDGDVDDDALIDARSEERRVGEGCASRWSPSAG